MTTEIIHSPLLENAFAHGHGPGDVALSQLQVGDCVAVMAPGDAPHHIIARITAIEWHARKPENLMRAMPKLLVAAIDSDDSWGGFFRPNDPAYAPGALIRFAPENISRIY